MTFYGIEQNSPEWFEARRGIVTDSSVGAILGNDPYRTRADVMRAMVREFVGVESEFTGNIATEYGKRHEDQAAEEFAMVLDVELRPGGFFTREDWAGASPDRLIGDDALLEIKCPFSLRDAKKRAPFKGLLAQAHYYDQMQFHLWVTGRRIAYFWEWCPADSYNLRTGIDPAWLDASLPKLRQFYAEYLDERESNAAIHCEPLRHEIDTPDAHKLAAEYDELAEAIGNAEARRSDILKEAVSMAKGKDAIFAGRKLTQVKRVGSIAYAKAVKALLPDADLEPYRGEPSSYWQMKG